MDPTPTETHLIQLAAAGDADAFALLFHRHYAMIHAFAYRLSLDPAEAQDVAQETFIRVARALPGFRNDKGSPGFRSWLYRIALNIARDGMRRRRREQTTQEEFALQNAGWSQTENDQDTPLHAALASLPEDWHRALVLVFYEGLNHAEAAVVLDCAETTVSWRIFQAKRRLRKTLLPSHSPKERP